MLSPSREGGASEAFELGSCDHSLEGITGTTDRWSVLVGKDNTDKFTSHISILCTPYEEWKSLSLMFFDKFSQSGRIHVLPARVSELLD